VGERRGDRRPWSLCTRLSWKRSGRTLDLAVVLHTHGHRGQSSMLVQLGEGEGNRRGGRRHVFSGSRFFSTKRRKARVGKTLEDGTGRRWRKEEESSVGKLLERGYGAVRRSVVEWGKQHQLYCIASGKKKKGEE
jgi:hypothetical protein